MENKILIACSDDACRNKILKLVTGKGLYIHSVWEDADLLLEILDRGYDIIIYDLDLSQFNGLKMVKIIRKIRPKVSLIVITKDPSKELGGKVLQEGVAYYTVKPINPEVVWETMVKFLKDKVNKQNSYSFKVTRRS